MGGLKPNTVVLGWPNNWRKRSADEPWRVFIDAIRFAAAAKMALIIPKGIMRYPESGDRIKGNIDIWWIVHDGGLLMLLPFLMKQHRTWKSCNLRIFSVAQAEDNSIQMKKDIKTFMYHLRSVATASYHGRFAGNGTLFALGAAPSFPRSPKGRGTTVGWGNACKFAPSARPGPQVYCQRNWQSCSLVPLRS